MGGWANKYTEAENDFIKTNYFSLTADEIAKHINRSKKSVLLQSFRLGLRKRDKYNDLWSDEKVQMLYDNHKIVGVKDLVVMLDIPEKSITAKLKKLKLVPFAKKTPWRTNEIKLLLELWKGGASSRQIAEKLNRTVCSVAVKIGKIENKPTRNKNGNAALFFNLE